MRGVNGLKKLYRAFGSPDPEARYYARHSLAGEVASRLGFRVWNHSLLWVEEPEFLSVWRGFPEATAQVHERKFFLHSLARSVADVPGDTAECGVWRGASSYLLCKAMEHPGLSRLHHCFDSWEGLSEPELADLPSDPRYFKWKKHDLSQPLEAAKRNLADVPWARFYPGWIPTRFAEVADRRFAFVHVDVDLYQPTRDALAFFYDRMEPGGVILCDDYGSTACPGAKKAFDEFLADRPERRVVHVPTGQGYFHKR